MSSIDDARAPIFAQKVSLRWHRHCSVDPCQRLFLKRILSVHGHKNFVGSAMVVAIVAVLGATTNAEAQFRRGRVIVAPRIVVGGSFFYDPWFDPFYGAYEFQYPIGPYGYPPMYRGYRIDATASVRVEVKPKEAEVYVDGYYAGIVDDFDGMFQRLRVAPGEHELTLYREGYRAVHQTLYLMADKTFKVRYTMERWVAGDVAEPRPTPKEPPQN